MTKIKVAFVDDHAVVRAGLRGYLESFTDMEVVGVAPSGEALLEQFGQWLPDVVVMDMLMPGGMDGVEATKKVRQLSPNTQVVILTAFSDNDRVIAGLRAGAISYVRKNSKLDVLLNAIRGAARGQSIVEPDIASIMMQEFVHINNPLNQEQLSEREQDVLKLLASGKTNKEIGVALSISGETVKTHVGNILAKFQLAHRTQAIVYALKKGLLSLDDISFD